MPGSSQSPPVESDGGAGPLPEFWPAVARAGVVRPVWIPWPVAILLVPLLWIMPKRMGPHFAAVRWPGVVIGHLFWTVYGMGCIAMAQHVPVYGWGSYLLGRSPGQEAGAVWPAPTVSQIFRSPLALLATFVTESVSNLGEYMLFWAKMIGAEVGLVVLAAALMPYVTAGERWTRLLGRAVKLTLWSTTSLVVLGLAYQVIELFAEPEATTLDYIWGHGPSPAEGASRRRLLDELWALATVVYVAWFFWIWLRSGLRCPGPAEGPGWEPRRPRCESCGYILTGLRPGDRCPECGRPVGDSLPILREPDGGGRPQSLFRRLDFMGETIIGSLVGGRFFRRLAVVGTQASARRYALLLACAGGLFAATINRLTGNTGRVWREWVGSVDTALPGIILFASWIVLGGGLILLLGWTATVAGLFGRRPLVYTAPVAFRAGTWWVFTLPAIEALVATGIDPFIELGNKHWLGGPPLSAWLVALRAALPLAFPMAGLLRLVFGMKQTRFANR